MTALTSPEGATGTAMAATGETKFEKFIGTLPIQMQAHIKMQELLGRAHQAVLAQTAWGQKATPEVRSAIARYLAKHNLDPSHVDVLGGNIYRNSRFYLDRLAHLQQAGLVVYAVYDHIENDPRLEALAESKDDAEIAQWARAERSRRRKERITHAITEEALSAVVFRLKLRDAQGNETAEITGAKPVYRSDKDPVGNANPVTSAESRAARRCLRNAIPSLPPAEKQWIDAQDADFEVLETKVAEKLATGDQPAGDHAPSVSLGDGVTFRAAGPAIHPLKTADDPFAEAPKAAAPAKEEWPEIAEDEDGR